MIDFVLYNNFDNRKNYLKDFPVIHSAAEIEKKKHTGYLYLLPETAYEEFLYSDKKVIVIGDLIPEIGEDKKKLLRVIEDHDIRFLSGFFYIIEIYSDRIKVISSVFNILPIYYYETEKKVYCSSKAHIINSLINDKLAVNKRFLLEQNLFNYSFFNETIYKGIYTVAANTYICLENSLGFIKHLNIDEYFVEKPIPWKENIELLADMFIDRVQKYFPQENDYITFTSGFDGRTLVACSLDNNKNVRAFAFGADDNVDMTLPLNQSIILGVDYFPIYLDNEYTKKHFFDFGEQLMKETDANSSFLHIHFPYSAWKISEKAEYIINGMMGSELFRALHIRGQATSEALVDFFMYEKDWMNRIKNASSLNFLKKGNYTVEMDELLREMEVYREDLKNRTQTINQNFYVFIFEEVFRKFFGMQIVPQFKYLKVRSPYIDFKLVIEILKTELAGVNNSFFTHNPLKRYKGQLFYAEVIKKTMPDLYNMKTGKGYAPRNLLNYADYPNIVFNFINKRIKKKFKKPVVDNLKIVSGIRQNYGKFDKSENNYYNIDLAVKQYNEGGWIANRDKFVETLSYNHFVNKWFSE